MLFSVLPTQASPPAPASPSTSFDHAQFDAILEQCVRGDGVDYPRVRQLFMKPLERYLERAASFHEAGASPNEQLALYINLYNATVLHAVAARFAPGYSVARDGFALFDEPLVALGGEKISLNRLENEVIRERFREPRVHAALVCAARSCPPLQPRAYRGEELEGQLEASMRRFVNDPSRNRIDPASRTLHLSRVFDWYAKDFGGPDRLAAYVDGYADADVPDFAVSFQDYSWELNLAPDTD